MSSRTTIFFAGGGTGGHLYPGIAVAEALRDIDSSLKPLFLCTQREIDRTILRQTNFEFIEQPIVPPLRNVGGLLKFWKSWRETKDLVRRVYRERRPAAVLGLGGYAAGVAVRYLAHKKRPTVILNPDVVPGKANQYLLRYVRTMCCQFDATRQHVPANQQQKVHVTGCPVRTNIIEPVPQDEARRRLGLATNLMTLVVTGASQGALTVNEAVLGSVRGLNLQGWQILHLSGKEHAGAVRTAYRELEVPAAVVDFTPNMNDVWSAADLAVSRSGASSCAELTATGVPSILFPYPYHKDQQQKLNAQVLADAGAAVLLDDRKDQKSNVAQLLPALQGLLRDSQKRKAMTEAARKLGRPQAASEVARLITQMLGDGR